MVATPIKPALKPVAEVDTDTLIATFLEQLGEPWTDAQEQALSAFKAGSADGVRVAAATNLDDPFCKALGYMASIAKKPPTLAVLLAESARAIANTNRARTIAELEGAISSAFSAE
ncbi:MAG: hypothetical protein AAGA83_24760 [Cyanobacteria bacterium P01_F01_bin.116]